MSAKNRPFLWETVYDDPKAKKEVRSIYHSAATWASHSWCYLAGSLPGPVNRTNIHGASSNHQQHWPQRTRARTTCRCTHSRSSSSKLTSVFVYCNLMSLTTRRCIAHFYTRLQVPSRCHLTKGLPSSPRRIGTIVHSKTLKAKGLSLNAHRYSSSRSRLSRKNNGTIYSRSRCRFKPSAPVSRWMKAKRKYRRRIRMNMMSWWTHAISPSRKR